MSKQSELEATWDFYWRTLGPEDDWPVVNYHFVAEEIVGTEPGIRKRIKETGLKNWDIDRAWKNARVGVELQGGLWMQTRTGRGKGHAHPRKIINDYHKLNCAQSIGWIIFQFDAETLQANPQACVQLVVDAIKSRGREAGISIPTPVVV